MILASVLGAVAGPLVDRLFTENPNLVDSSRNTWGWFLILRGVAQGLVALGVWGRVGVRWIGVAIASAKAMVHLLFIPACPFWSQCLFPLDILVVYGLIAHGNRVDALPGSRP